MFVERDHGRLFYDVVEPKTISHGAVETIIFLHGVATNHEVWRSWVPHVSEQRRLLLIGTRGYGQSADMGQVASWSLDDVSDDILAVADHAGAEQFHAVGESFGGTAVLNLALRGLERVRSATMVSAAHKGGQLEKVKEWRANVEQKGIAWWSDQMMIRRFKDGAISQDEHAWFSAQQRETRAGPLLHMGELLLQTDLTCALGSLACPLFIISPDQSPFVTPDIGAELVQLVPGAQLCVIPNTRHGIVFSHGEFCAQQLVQFLNRL